MLRFCRHTLTIQPSSHTDASSRYRPLSAKYWDAMGSLRLWMRISVRMDWRPVPTSVLMPKMRPKQLSSLNWPAIFALKTMFLNGIVSNCNNLSS